MSMSPLARRTRTHWRCSTTCASGTISPVSRSSLAPSFTRSSWRESVARKAPSIGIEKAARCTASRPTSVQLLLSTAATCSGSNLKGRDGSFVSTERMPAATVFASTPVRQERDRIQSRGEIEAFSTRWLSVIAKMEARAADDTKIASVEQTAAEDTKYFRTQRQQAGRAETTDAAREVIDKGPGRPLTGTEKPLIPAQKLPDLSPAEISTRAENSDRASVKRAEIEEAARLVFGELGRAFLNLADDRAKPGRFVQCCRYNPHRVRSSRTTRRRTGRMDKAGQSGPEDSRGAASVPSCRRRGVRPRPAV